MKKIATLHICIGTYITFGEEFNEKNNRIYVSAYINFGYLQELWTMKNMYKHIEN